MARQKDKTSVVMDEEMNITSLIDCTFLLLIFFMVTTVFKNPARLDLELPLTEYAETLDQRQIMCEVGPEGDIAVNGLEIDIESFETQLLEIKKDTGMSSLLIKADVAAKHGVILRLMKMAKEVKIESIALATDTETEQ